MAQRKQLPVDRSRRWITGGLPGDITGVRAGDDFRPTRREARRPAHKAGAARLKNAEQPLPSVPALTG